MSSLIATSRVLVSFLFIILLYKNVGAFDPIAFKNNIDHKNKQTVWSGQIDSLIIKRGPAEFALTDGKLTLFDFGSGIPCGLYFSGKVHFRYIPPDDIERYQLNRLYGEDSIDYNLEEVALLFSTETENLPDTLSLKKEKVPGKAWKAINKASNYAFDYLSEYIPNKLLNDLLSNQPGTYFLADIWQTRYDHLVFIEDHRFDDIYRLYKPRMAGGIKTYDVLGGYSSHNSSPSERGLIPIDVKHYKIESSIEPGGDMTVSCRIYFKALDESRRFLIWQWFEKNKPLAAFDSDGDSLTIITRKDEWGLGIVLNKPLRSGYDDYIEIKYECNAVRNIFGIYVLEGQTFWYPQVMPWDRATYDLSYDCRSDYEVISCGTCIESETANGITRSRWLLDYPVKYVSFNLGVFETKEFDNKSAPPVIVYLGENFRHDERAHFYAARYDNPASDNMLDLVGEDVTRSLKLFTDYFGPCPFDTIRVSEIPWGHGQGSPGILHLSWYTFQFDDLLGSEERFRAHEVSHQWFGHIIENEHYCDTWILEGMAELCGLMYLESVAEDSGVINKVLENWRREIMVGGQARALSTDKLMVGIENYTKVVSDGSKAGPVVLGSRLDNSISHDYQVITYTKGAYIWQMIRYMLYDFQTGSDEKFLSFVRDMLELYAGKSITTENLQKLLEEFLGTDMNWFFDQWVYGIDIPTYKFSYKSKFSDSGEYEVHCNVSQDGVPDDFMMPVPIAIYTEAGDTSYYQVWIDKPEMEFQLPAQSIEPAGVIFNVKDAVLCKVK